MQKRQSDRAMYFQELAATCRKYYIPYIEAYKAIRAEMNILEVGCGDGGNLLPFAELGCHVVGIDIATCRINDAVKFFQERKVTGDFRVCDVFQFKPFEQKFDLIICHDVFEHIADKETFLLHLRQFLSNNGFIFMSFPAWQMPFGGHQQICRNTLLSHLPFIHLLPTSFYRYLLALGKEKEGTINELLQIKQTKCSIELFHRLVRRTNYRILSRRLYFINPHYEIKFGLKPRKLCSVIEAVPYVHNYFTTSCFYILSL